MIDLVLRIGWRMDGQPTRVDGQFIVEYDPTIARDGTFLLTTSADINTARGFTRVNECWDFLNRPCPNIPYDSPGHVNRPIRCYCIEIIPRER